ncbi:MAG: hypothetical protein PVI30_01095 [Myxococcales bacterium]
MRSASPAPAPPPTATPTPTPSPTVGARPTPQEAPGEEEDEEATDGASARVPWNVALAWTQGYNAAGLTRGGEQSFNPEYSWSFLLRAGYRFPDTQYQVSVVQPYLLELTESEITTSSQEFQAGDTSLRVNDLRFFTLTEDSTLVLIPTAAIGLPTSDASDAATMVLSTGANVTGLVTYSKWLEGVNAGLSLTYSRRWNSSNTVRATKPFPCVLGNQDASQDCVHLGGSSTTRDVFVLGVSANANFSSTLSANLSVGFGWNLAYPLADARITTITDAEYTLPDQSLTHWRNSRTIRIGLNYFFEPWLIGAAFVRNAFSERGPDGTLRAPFEPLDTVLGTTLTLNTDGLNAMQATGNAPRQR